MHWNSSVFRVSRASLRMDVNRSRQWKFFKTCERVVGEESRAFRSLGDPIQAVSAGQSFTGSSGMRRKSKPWIFRFLANPLGQLRRDRHHAYRKNAFSSSKLFERVYFALHPVCRHLRTSTIRFPRSNFSLECPALFLRTL